MVVYSDDKSVHLMAANLDGKWVAATVGEKVDRSVDTRVVRSAVNKADEMAG